MAVKIPDHLGGVFGLPAHEHPFVGDKYVVEEQPALRNARVRHFHIGRVFQLTLVAGCRASTMFSPFDVPGHHAGQGIVLVRLLVGAARQQKIS